MNAVTAPIGPAGQCIADPRDWQMPDRAAHGSNEQPDDREQIDFVPATGRQIDFVPVICQSAGGLRPSRALSWFSIS